MCAEIDVLAVEFEAAADMRRQQGAEDAEAEIFESAVRDLEERYGSQIEALQVEVAQLTQENAVLALERDQARAEARQIAEKGRERSMSLP